MEDATKSAEVIRSEILSFRNGYMLINPSNECSSCQEQLVTKAFYTFPCSHCFHTDCLIKEMQPFVDPSIINNVKELQVWNYGRVVFYLNKLSKILFFRISSAPCIKTTKIYHNHWKY